MRKIIVVVLAVALLTIGVGGLVYAQTTTHEAVKGDKLIATVPLGTFTSGAGDDVRYTSWFEITNPDCNTEIVIERIAIIRADGVVIYEGPFIELIREAGEVTEEIIITEPLQPHHVLNIVLRYMMKDPDSAEPDRWLTPGEANALPFQDYTLELLSYRKKSKRNQYR